MLKLIRALLCHWVECIDASNSNLSESDLKKALSYLQNILLGDEMMSKTTACDYLKISRATFDNYVRNGFIPKGEKRPGFKEKSWYKSDLDKFNIDYHK